MDTPPDPASPLGPARPTPPRPLPPRPARRDYAAEEEAGRRLLNAQFLLRRGQAAEAEAATRAILAERPDDAAAHELLGDVLAARADEPGAASSYGAAQKLEPGRASAEAKFAKIALRQAEARQREKMGVAYAASDTALVRGGGRGAWLAILGSSICPGLSQIVRGQYVKGGLMLGGQILGLLLLAGLAHDRPGRSYFGPGFWIVTALMTGGWIYAGVDAAITPAPPAT